MDDQGNWFPDMESTPGDNVVRSADTPESGRSPGEEHGTPLQYSCLENFMGREAWQATVHGVAKSWTQLSN